MRVIPSPLVRGFVTLTLVVAAARSAAADCRPTAVASGDPALVAGLEARLAASGIATRAAPGCPRMTVVVQQRGGQIHMTLADAAQRTGERDVQDVTTAAAIVESWTYQEVDAGMLPAEPPVVEKPRRAWGASVMATGGLGTNGGTTWLGGAAASCVRAGPLCVGALVRAQVDTTATGETATIAQDAYAVAAYATADLPRRAGGFVVTPGVGVGWGYLHATTHHHDAMNNLLDVPSSDHELRAGAHVAVLRPWGRAAALVDVWGDAAVVRSDAQFGPRAALSVSLGVRVEL